MWAGQASRVLLGIFIAFSIFLFIPVKVYVDFMRSCGREELVVRLGLFGGAFKVKVLSLSSLFDHLQKRVGEHLKKRAGRIFEGLKAFDRFKGFGTEGRVAIDKGAKKARGIRGWARGTRAQVIRSLLLILKEGAKDGGYVVQDFRLQMRVGTGDAATTGISVGAAWGILGSLIPLVSRRLYPSTFRPKIVIQPDFQGPRLDLSAHCIFALNPGYIILRGMAKEIGMMVQKRVDEHA